MKPSHNSIMGHFDDLFPETLYETIHLKLNRVCLVCAKARAVKILRAIDRDVAPICADCANGWNFYGYEIFKKITPKELVWKVIKYKMKNWFSVQLAWLCYKDLRAFGEWSQKMKAFIKHRSKAI